MGFFDRITGAFKTSEGDYDPFRDGLLSEKLEADKDDRNGAEKVKKNIERAEKAFEQRFIDRNTNLRAKKLLFNYGYLLCRQEETRLNHAINTIEAFGLYPSSKIKRAVQKYSQEGVAAGWTTDAGLERFYAAAGDFSLEELEIIPGLREFKVQQIKNSDPVSEQLTIIIDHIEKAQGELDKERNFLEARTAEIKMKLFALSYALHETGQELRFGEPKQAPDSALNRQWKLPPPETWEYSRYGDYLTEKQLIEILEYVDTGLVASLAGSMKADAFLIAVSRERGAIQESIFKMKEIMEELNASLQAYDGGEGGRVLKEAAKNFTAEKLVSRAELFFSEVYGGIWHSKFGGRMGSYMDVWDQDCEDQVVPAIDKGWVGREEVAVNDTNKCWTTGKAGNKYERETAFIWKENALPPREIEALQINRLYQSIGELFIDEEMLTLLERFRPQFTESLKEWELVFERRYLDICKNPAVFLNKYRTFESDLPVMGAEHEISTLRRPDIWADFNSVTDSDNGAVTRDHIMPTVYVERFVEDVDNRPDIWVKVSRQGVEGIRVEPLTPEPENN